MANDKELLIETISDYAANVSSSLLGFNLGVATKSLVKIGINNLISKQPYKIIMDFCFDDKGMLPDKEVFWQAMEESLETHPIIIAGIKFDKKDVKEIRELFNKK